MEHPLIGMWKLTGVEREGSREELQPAPGGCLVYTAQGWMTESLVLPIPDSDGQTRIVIYCGTYTIDDATVIHRPAFHLDASQIGQELPRGFECADNGRQFTLISGPLRLHWERVEHLV